MIRLHHLERSRSHRVLWLLEEMGVPYEMKTYKRDPRTKLAPPELRKIHPLGKSPAVEIDGEVFAESAVILDELSRRFAPALRVPEGDPQASRYQYWMHYAEGSLMPPLVQSLIFQMLSRPPVPVVMRPLFKAASMGVHQAFLNRQFVLHRDYLEAELTKADFLLGDRLSVADIQLSYPAEALLSVLPQKSEAPRLAAYLKRLHSRPAYQRAVEKGGPVQTEL